MRDPNLFTFAAYNSGELVGTMGVRLDAKDVPVIHVIAARLADHSPLLGSLTVPSRDFH